MSAIPVSVVIATLNEAHQIDEAVRQCAWADEVIVADGGSHDGTVALARHAGAAVVEHAGGTIGAQRNAAFAAARNQWVLVVDADERVTDELIAAVGAAVAAPTHRAYEVWRRNYFLGWERNRGSWGRDRVIRLVRREERYDDRRVHEGFPPISDVGLLDGRLLHHPYRDLDHCLEKIRTYARWGALDLWDRGRRATWSDVALRPAFRFVREWLFRGLWLDGRAGFVAAGIDAFGVFRKYAELWALERRPPVSGPAPGAGR